MKTEFKANKPAEIEFSLTLTAPLGTFQRLRDQLSTLPSPHSHYPASALSSALYELVKQAEEKFQVEQTP